MICASVSQSPVPVYPFARTHTWIKTTMWQCRVEDEYLPYLWCCMRNANKHKLLSDWRMNKGRSFANRPSNCYHSYLHPLHKCIVNTRLLRLTTPRLILNFKCVWQQLHRHFHNNTLLKFISLKLKWNSQVRHFCARSEHQVSVNDTKLFLLQHVRWVFRSSSRRWDSRQDTSP